MRQLLLAMIAVVLAVSTVNTPTAGFAASPPRVEGSICPYPRIPSGTWIGFFDGYEERSDLFSRHDYLRSVTFWRCFKTKADCVAWKYWMQTDYFAGSQHTWCRKKK